MKLIFLLLIYASICYCDLKCENDPNRNVISGTKANIENCGKKFINLKNYERASVLTEIDASQNDITQIENETFAGCSKVSSLDLQQNLIQKISVGAFYGLINLKVLHLQHNQISKLHPQVFQLLWNLKEISLFKNFIGLLEKELFRANKNLKNINLSENRIIAVETGIFDDFPDVENLYMEKNLCIDNHFYNSLRGTVRSKIGTLEKCTKNYQDFESIGLLKALRVESDEKTICIKIECEKCECEDRESTPTPCPVTEKPQPIFYTTDKANTDSESNCFISNEHSLILLLIGAILYILTIGITIYAVASCVRQNRISDEIDESNQENLMENELNNPSVVYAELNLAPSGTNPKRANTDQVIYADIKNVK
jgi:hypothetical protein